MALQNRQRDKAQQPDQGKENQGKTDDPIMHIMSDNPDNQSVSRQGDTSDAKGFRTDTRKDEKEADDNYDSNRQS